LTGSRPPAFEALGGETEAETAIQETINIRGGIPSATSASARVARIPRQGFLESIRPSAPGMLFARERDVLVRRRVSITWNQAEAGLADVGAHAVDEGLLP
jgi:hypothetical protein